MKTASRAGAYTVEQVDLPAAPDALLREIAALRNVLDRELLPDDPPSPPEAFMARVRSRPKMFQTRNWIARHGGAIVATAFLTRIVGTDTNQHLREAGVSVAPPHRRRGIGRSLYRQLVREWDRALRGTGRERRLVLAVAEATGETAGFTELQYDPKTPHVVFQQGTAVLPPHRGNGLGKWLKATNLERVRHDWPGARFVRTGNADSNAPMLAINTRLGFKPAWATVVWEIGIADARRYAEG